MVREDGKMDGAHYRTVWEGKPADWGAASPPTKKCEAAELRVRSFWRCPTGSDTPPSLYFRKKTKHKSPQKWTMWVRLGSTRNGTISNSCILWKRQRVIHQASQLIWLSKLCLRVWVTGVRVSHDKWLSFPVCWSLIRRGPLQNDTLCLLWARCCCAEVWLVQAGSLVERWLLWPLTSQQNLCQTPFALKAPRPCFFFNCIFEFIIPAERRWWWSSLTAECFTVAMPVQRF